MIAVIADDLTGAAELGGLAIRYNLVSEISNRVNPSSKADLLIISTDTRSLTKEAAERITEQVSHDLLRLRPRLIFKKIDSVLRGHVLAEVRVQKNVLNLKRALIVAGNPGLGRTVVEGIYLLNGHPVHLSSFSNDPEFPITSSSVHEMLHADNSEVSILGNHQAMPETGIIVGEAKDTGDLAAWCGKIDGDTLIAGAAEFFTAVLEHLNLKETLKTKDTTRLQLPALMICGSTFQKSNEFVSKMLKAGMPVSYIPRDVVTNSLVDTAAFYKWIDETVFYLERSGKAIIAVDPAMKGFVADALTVKSIMAEATALIATRIQINECLVEGGSTSSAIMQKLGIENLYPIQELAPGVIRMGVKERKDFHITLKPGSYEWPADILQF